MSKLAAHCDECRHHDPGECMDDTALSPGVIVAWIRKPHCAKGHKPRFMCPRSPMDNSWGFKRRCEDFDKITF